MRRIGLFGGSFDPIHFGHLMIAEYLRVEANLDEVIFIPTGNPPHKSNVTDAKMRLEMVELATSDNENFYVSDIETYRTEIAYTVDTVNALKSHLNGELFFLIGLDTLFQLKTWKKIEELMKELKFIVALRPNYIDMENIIREIEFLKSSYNGKITIVETPLYEISSTDIKNRIKNNKSVKYLVPDQVEKFIKKNEIYGR